MERPIEFMSDGMNLRGVLHISQANQKRMGVIFLNAGLVYRAGPYRLYIKAARQLCREGFACLRFDFPGVGDSEGEVKRTDFDMFSETSHTNTAVEVLMREAGVQSVTLIGMCTGARNAIRTARENLRIESLVLASMPITYDNSRTPTAKIRSAHSLGSTAVIPRAYGYMKTKRFCSPP